MSMNFLMNFFKGLIISISQIVPGVSGGTIAMVLGIYDKLLHSINNIFSDFKNQYKLLLEVGLGAVIGIFLFSNIVGDLLEMYPIQLGYLFIGVILGGAPLMFKKATINGFNKKSLVYLVIGIIVVSLMTNNNTDNSSIIISLNITNFIWLFVSGIIIAVALILPGISGSFMLLVLGLYNTVINAVTQFNIPILLPIVLGGVVGTISTTKLIENLLIKHPQSTYMIIFGFILGSVFKVYPGYSGVSSITGIILGILGFISIYYISKE